ncbi:MULTISPECIES: trypsin-like peptidase domain-containing protein [Rhodomicrobium]|uniref:trypsin-like serine peptidase n=1 Tax=Rhodomicrobium TaxID=1068 RepID=UPI000B4A9FC4|nr:MULTISPECIES: trypsin-like peptidase domain-containing protein [Rhodomicrobium]
MKQFWLACLAGLIAAPGACPAAGDLHPGIVGEDDRVPVQSVGAPWDAIGQVNVSGYRNMSICTGTLVAPDLVLTAAHCLMDRLTGAPFPLRSIHFLAGVRRGANQGHATAKCLRFPDGYQFIAPDLRGTLRSAPKVPIAALRQDAAIIVLNERLKAEPAALADAAAISPETQLVHASYPADRRYVLSMHENCRRLGAVDEGRLWATDCDTHPASSGGPVFMRGEGGLQLAAIMVATAGGQANLALPAPEWSELLGARDCP